VEFKLYEDCRRRGKWMCATFPESLRSRGPTGDRTRDLLLVSPTPYRSATTPPATKSRFLRRCRSGDVLYRRGRRTRWNWSHTSCSRTSISANERNSRRSTSASSSTRPPPSSPKSRHFAEFHINLLVTIVNASSRPITIGQCCCN